MLIIISLVALAGCARGGFGTDNVELVKRRATPPFVIIDASPGAGTTQTVFTFSGARSWDREDGQDNLTMQWDWDVDGTPDDYGTTATHQFTEEGVFAVTLSVEDSDGQVGQSVAHVIVAPPSDVVMVTTDEDTVLDDGVTSLREAVSLANQRGSGTNITFAGPMTIPLSGPGLQISAPDTAIAGEAGVILDGSALAVGEDCVVSVGARNTLFSIEVRNCPKNGIHLAGNSNWIAHCLSRDNGEEGIDVDGDAIEVGPNNVILANGRNGLLIDGLSPFVHKNTLNGNFGIGLSEGLVGDVRVLGNLIYDNDAGGIGLSTAATGANVVWNNTIYGNQRYGISIRSSTAQMDLRNNILSANVGNGAEAPSGWPNESLSQIDNNLYFGNDGSACANCPEEPHSIDGDPRFVDLANADFRLAPDSPAIDAGAPVWFDANGAASGLYFGTGWDIGAWEMP